MGSEHSMYDGCEGDRLERNSKPYEKSDSSTRIRKTRVRRAQFHINRNQKKKPSLNNKIKWRMWMMMMLLSVPAQFAVNGSSIDGRFYFLFFFMKWEWKNKTP